MTLIEFFLKMRELAREVAREHAGRPVLAVDFEPARDGSLALAFRFKG